MSKIFISHASADTPTALAIAKWLTANGWDEYFLDVAPERGLAAGERWQEALKRAAGRCEAVLFLISPTWRDSKWCLAEFLLAKNLGKAIFGVMIEPTPLEMLPVEMTAEWQICDLVPAEAELAEREDFQVHLDKPPIPRTTVSLSAAGLAQLKYGLQQAGLDAATFPWPPESEPDRPPYPGLRALDVEDAAIFFGRDVALVRALDELRLLRQQGTKRLFVILGASGAGKSSFLRAGLLPRLARDDRHFLPLPIIRPERAAISGPAGLLASIEGAFQRLGIQKNRAGIRKTLNEPQGFPALLDEIRTHAHARIAIHTTPPSSRQGLPGPSARDGLNKELPGPSARDGLNEELSEPGSQGGQTNITPPILLIAIDQGEELFGADGGEESERLLSLLREVTDKVGVSALARTPTGRTIPPSGITLLGITLLGFAPRRSPQPTIPPMATWKDPSFSSPSARTPTNSSRPAPISRTSRNISSACRPWPGNNTRASSKGRRPGRPPPGKSFGWTRN